MTGYKPKYSPWAYIGQDEVMYPAGGIVKVEVLIKDGSRIGLTDDFPVAGYAIPDTFEYNVRWGVWYCESNLSCWA
jgi:hypothetical protein